MENASKALIMAAGVLIGLIIISLAIYLFTNFATMSRNVHEQIDETRIGKFNEQFLVYEGKEVNIYDIISVANLAIENNSYYELDVQTNGNYYIKVTLNNVALEKKTKDELKSYMEADLQNINLASPDLKTYNCKVSINNTTKLVNKIEFYD